MALDYDPGDYYTSVEDVRSELRAEGEDMVDFAVLTPGQVERVGLQPAHLEVTERLEGNGMSTDRLELIERYLAGHFAMTSGIDAVRQTQSLSAGSTSHGYVGDFSRDDYGSTTLGQKAIALDETGELARTTDVPIGFETFG